MNEALRRVRVIDSHTEGEPTRVVIDGGPDLGRGTMAERLAIFREKFDDLRSGIINEPRGSDILVGALLTPPTSARAVCGVIFFNNVGFLNACGHGTIGVARTLAHLGKIGAGSHVIQTPVGEVTIHLDPAGRITIDNVASYRAAKDMAVEVPGRGRVVGDVAWGGNWFFLISDHGQTLSLENAEELTRYAWDVRAALTRAGIRGDDRSPGGGEIDHIELFGPPQRSDADSKNFVLCPGKAYDRSPCGTGTSAKMACLFADGMLNEGQVWRQESIIGSLFTGSVRREGEKLIPSISGSAHITGEATLILDPGDPFRYGIRAR
ncbi:MAG: proline racemase family protein [Phycisphaerae bacterium]|nr:proline racemase family protein [Phycisphaerae bacterium]